jgi:hypothetical protein
MSKTRAKFYVSSIELFSGSTKVNMNVVTRGAENKTWASATPSGQLSMNIRTEAAGHFQLGKEYYVDFTPAEAPPSEGDGHEPEPYDAGYGSTVCAKCGIYKATGQGVTDDGWGSHRDIYAKKD